MNDSSSQRVFIVVGLAFGLLLVLSALPLAELSGNLLKDFHLFEDLLPARYKTEPVAQEMTTPDFDEMMAELAALEGDGSSPSLEGGAVADSCSTDTTSRPAAEPVAAEALSEAPTRDGNVLVECYAADGLMLPHFRAALAKAASQEVRIGVIGDSFIEGDIMTQDLRALFQDSYGGSGVGFMAMHSDFPGFRKSVRQTDSGWTLHDLRTIKGSDSLRTISGDYAEGGVGATAKFKGVSLFPQTSAWGRSSFLCIAPQGGSVTLTNDAGSQVFDIEASTDVQCLQLDGPTSSFSVKNNGNPLIALGAYLHDNSGVQVDCMSIRGYSGMAHSKTNRSLAAKLAQWVDYDLIILEYGTNAITPGHTDYSWYANALAVAVKRLRECYPVADILVLGVGDRGSKTGSEVKSLPACTAMVKAQRQAAAKAGVHFWDTRAAMGGENAAVDWRKRKLMNADYIHLNHKGGGELARLLYNALTDSHE